MASERISDDIVYGRTALREGIPWIVPTAFEFLYSIAKPSWKVFEWGAGGSTIWFVKNVNYTISIEHNREWYDRVHNMLKKHIYDAGIVPNDFYLLMVPGVKIVKDKDRFCCYADVIRMFPDEFFDLVFVDGEASSRGWCVRNAVPKLKPGGWLMLDNSDWYRGAYTPNWEKVDFVAKGLSWISQPGKFDWWTSFLQKPGGLDNVRRNMTDIELRREREGEW